VAQRVLVVVAVDEEAAAICAGFDHVDTTPDGASPWPWRDGRVGDTDVIVLVSGVGPAAAAAAAAYALTREADISLVLSAGIAGGFDGRAKVGDVVLATRIVAADLGADRGERFESIAEMGYGPSSFSIDAETTVIAASALHDGRITAQSGAILTVSTVTGRTEAIEAFESAHPDSIAEGMEGFGVATAARAFGKPVLELRTVSNIVGESDKATWDFVAAFDTLTRAVALVVQAPFAPGSSR
jgi:futalosine hydrolase